MQAGGNGEISSPPGPALSAADLHTVQFHRIDFILGLTQHSVSNFEL
jgi:hypothetical protein